MTKCLSESIVETDPKRPVWKVLKPSVTGVFEVWHCFVTWFLPENSTGSYNTNLNKCDGKKNVSQKCAQLKAKQISTYDYYQLFCEV